MKKLALIILIAVYGFASFGPSSWCSTDAGSYIGQMALANGEELPAGCSTDNCINQHGGLTIKEHHHTAGQTHFSTRGFTRFTTFYSPFAIAEVRTAAFTAGQKDQATPAVPVYILYCVYRI